MATSTTVPDRNAKVLQALREFEDARGYQPTVAEIAESAGMTKSMVQGALWQLLAQRPAVIHRSKTRHIRKWSSVREAGNDPG